jgi:hypothetical protein
MIGTGMLNNREVAALAWLLVGAVWVLSRPSVRASLANVARTFATPTLLVPLGMLGSNAAGLAWLGYRLGLWQVSLVPETIEWFVGSAAVLFLNLPKAAADERFFRRAVFRTLELTTLIGFFMNLFVLSLPLELLLQSVLLILVLVPVVAGREPRLEAARKLADRIAASVGLGLAGFVSFELVRHVNDLHLEELLVQLALPVWMTVGVVPLLYALALYVAYEAAFIRIDFFISDADDRRRIKLALVSVLRWHLRGVARFGQPWIRRAEAARGLRATMTIVRAFRDNGGRK